MASKPMCRCMNDGHAGVSRASRMYCSGSAPAGSRRGVSQMEALEMTALLALIVPPPRSCTPTARPFSSSTWVTAAAAGGFCVGTKQATLPLSSRKR